MKRAVFASHARFRLVDEAGDDIDLEIERRGANGTVVARRLESGEPRTFGQLELRLAQAEHRLQFHLEGRHVADSDEPPVAIAPREPDFGAVPARDRRVERPPRCVLAR